MSHADDVIASRLLHLLEKRRPDASICPSEVARSLEEDEPRWRELMPDIRRVAAAMAAAQVIEITRQDVTVDLDEQPAGPIRLRRGPRFKRP